MVAAEFWIVEEDPRRVRWTQVALGVIAGLCLGLAVAAFAGPLLPLPPAGTASDAEPRAVRSFEPPALDREWRGTRTPVDVDRMFMRRR